MEGPTADGGLVCVVTSPSRSRHRSTPLHRDTGPQETSRHWELCQELGQSPNICILLCHNYDFELLEIFFKI